MQNKANLKIDPMVVTKVLTNDYNKRTLGIRGKNKPKTKPIYNYERWSMSFQKRQKMQNEPNLNIFLTSSAAVDFICLKAAL